MSVLNQEYVVVNGIGLHCTVAGTGPLILFLHGFPEFWYQWRKQLVEFSKDHLVVAPDMRGYNLSDKPAEVDEYALPYLVEDIRGLADHFSYNKRFILVGHDWGGFVAWAFASAHPGYLEKLVIINAPHPSLFERLLSSDPAQQNASLYIPKLRLKQAEQKLSANNYAALVDIVLNADLPTGAFTEEDKAEYIKAWSQPGALTGALNYYRANRLGVLAPTPDSELESELRAASAGVVELIVEVPTLVIWGERDTALVMRNVDELDGFVPQLTIKRVPDGSHWIIHEKPNDVNFYIRGFIG